jgi:hypothetical protein
MLSPLVFNVYSVPKVPWSLNRYEYGKPVAYPIVLSKDSRPDGWFEMVRLLYAPKKETDVRDRRQ